MIEKYLIKNKRRMIILILVLSVIGIALMLLLPIRHTM